jgi:hypothetical protein
VKLYKQQIGLDLDNQNLAHAGTPLLEMVLPLFHSRRKHRRSHQFFNLGPRGSLKTADRVGEISKSRFEDLLKKVSIAHVNGMSPARTVKEQNCPIEYFCVWRGWTIRSTDSRTTHIENGGQLR